MSKALKFILGCLLIGVILIVWKTNGRDSMVDVVEGQLQKLREHHITQAYYDYTSQEYQEGTSLSAFQKFISSHPVLSENKLFTIEKKNVTHGEGNIKGIVISNDLQEMNIEYGLIKEEGKWKILRLRLKEFSTTDRQEHKSAENRFEGKSMVVKTVRRNTAGPYDDAPSRHEETPFHPFRKNFREDSILWGRIRGGQMADIVEEQLEKLWKREAAQAYDTCTSQDFRKTTSFTAFQEFICLHPILSSNNMLTIEKRKVGRGVGTIEGVVASSDFQKMHVEYRLIEENGKWKILGLSLKELDDQKRKKAEGKPVKPFRRNETSKDALYAHAFHQFQEETPFHPFQKNLRVKKKGQGKDAAALELMETVDGQLKAFRKHDILDAYYGYVSQNFQKETPFRTFQEYVRAHPILLRHRGVNFKDRRIQDDRGYVDLVLPSEKGDYRLHYQLTREKGGWRIWSLRILLPPEEAAKQAATDPRTLVPPVRDILGILASRKIKEAYESTAKEFQDASSFDAFQQFIERYPVLIKRDLADIQSGTIEDGVGKLCANLHDEEGISVLEFRLGFEEGEWKIWGMKMMEHPEEKPIAVPTGEIDPDKAFTERIFTMIQEQLNALRHQDFFAVYFHFSSDSYRRANSLQQLEAFLKKYPFFTQNLCAAFTSPSHENGRATVCGIITTFDQKKYPVRYELINEEGLWKIHGFTLLSEEKAEQLKEMAAASKEALHPIGIRG